MIYFCCDSLRREETRQSDLNGIDFLVVVDDTNGPDIDRQRFLHVHLLKPAPGSLSLENVAVEGPSGSIRVLGVNVVGNIATIELASRGDFSVHTLRLRRSQLDDQPPSWVDPRLSAVDFSFKVSCDSDFDCVESCRCNDEPRSVPEISYLARDTDSFRQAILDRIAVLQPMESPPHAVDQKMAIVDALAVLADRVAYAQDAANSEAYLSQVQHRVSARRLGVLVDYALDQGRSARAFVHLEVDGDVPASALGKTAIVPVGTAFTTRLTGWPARLPLHTSIPAGALVFEAASELEALYEAHNELRFYTWSDQRCCLAAGSIAATLAGHHPTLAPGMFVAFEEVVGPRTGSPADRDRSNRQVVRLLSVDAYSSPGQPLTDPVTGAQITEIGWAPTDALERPLCLSAETDEEHGRVFVDAVSVARGNVLLVDHGRTVTDENLGMVPALRGHWAPGLGPEASASAVSNASEGRPGACQEPRLEPMAASYRPRLRQGPLTFTSRARAGASARESIGGNGRPLPALSLTGTLNGVDDAYKPQSDLLGSGPHARDVVTEIDDDGRALLRFGNNINGFRPKEGTAFAATYRVGLGPSGNVGEDTLVHIRSDVPEILSVRNITPGTGGRRPETIEEMRRRAPFMFRRQNRAVTRSDYDDMAQRFEPPEGPLQSTVTNVMFTGSWNTVLTTVDRRGGLAVTQEFERDLRKHLEIYRMAGRDLEVEGPIDVPIEIAMGICVIPTEPRAKVRSALRERFSNRVLADGTLGAFHPDRLQFGKPLDLSPLTTLARSIPGVMDVQVTLFRRFLDPDSSGLQERRLTFGRREIPRLDNDPGRPSNGVLRLEMRGGR